MAENLRGLTHEECLDLLRSACIGRVSVTHRALPAIVPVNYAFDHGIVFRTRSGGMLDGACRGSVVAFEIDELAADGASGWSVLVVGVADALDGSERLRALGLGIASALGDSTDHFVRIPIGTVTGRRVGRHAVGLAGVG